MLTFEKEKEANGFKHERQACSDEKKITSFSLTKYLIIGGLRNFEIQFCVFSFNVDCQMILGEEAHTAVGLFARKRLHDIVVHRR